VTFTARMATLLPETLAARAAGLTHRRAEPELGRLRDLCGRGGVMIDVGAWYRPWLQHLAKRADRLISIEPTARNTNDTANVAVGSSVGLATRIGRMMSIAHGQPVMWVNTRTLLPTG
jgi:hypothetical protein